MSSVREAYTAVVQELKLHKIENWAQEAKILISWALCENEAIIFTKPDMEFPPNALDILKAAVKKRIEHYPLQYIIGEVEFMGLPFKVNKDVLIPRPDTEVLVERALELLKGRTKARVLDMCTGSGCIIISVAKYTDARCIGIDLSAEALAVADENAKLNATAVDFIQGDLFEKLQGEKLDFILSNPPYIDAYDMTVLQEEVRYEPEMALRAGEDGLDFYRRLAKDAKKFLRAGGVLLMEHGINQEAEIRKLLENEGYMEIMSLQDYAGINRVIEARVK